MFYSIYRNNQIGKCHCNIDVQIDNNSFHLFNFRCSIIRMIFINYLLTSDTLVATELMLGDKADSGLAFNPYGLP